MKLLELNLKNFKGIRRFTLDAQGNNVAVYGDNATGKTTLWDSFQWLLFDKDSANRKDFDIKTLDETGEPLHGLDHEVEGSFEVAGKELALRKVYAEKWTKKRGSATKEFTGHTVEHFIDGVPVKKKEYDDRIAGIVDEGVFKLLTSPTYFNEQLHWQDRRKILLKVCGDISDIDVIFTDDKLSGLPEILNGRTIDDHRKIIQARRTEINRELDRIPVRIDEVRRGLPDVTGLDELQLRAKIEELKKSIRGKEQQITRIEAGGEVAEKTKNLREVEADLFTIQNFYHKGQNRRVIDAQKKLYDAQGKRPEQTMAIDSAEKIVAYNSKAIADIEARIEVKRREWHAANDEQFCHEQDEVCPTCGQALPAGKLHEAREKALANFNQHKASRLEGISSEGKRLSVQKDELEEETREKQNKVDRAKEALKSIEEEVIVAAIELEQVKRSMDKYTEDPAYQEKLREKAVIETAISELKEGSRQEVDSVLAEIAALQEQVKATEGRLMDIARSAQGEKRIEELETQERRLAAEYEKLEQELYLTEQFIRSKVQLLEEKINSCFKHARFKLFNVLVNGAVEECCETLYQGVPYNSALNNAARINVGLDIINTLSEHYGFGAPIWIDNREAVTRLIPARAQVISLIVSEPDKILRVESAEVKIKEAV